MTRKRRSFSPEFKQGAASLVLEHRWILEDYYNQQQPHTYNGGISPVVAEENLKILSEIS